MCAKKAAKKTAKRPAAAKKASATREFTSFAQPLPPASGSLVTTITNWILDQPDTPPAAADWTDIKSQLTQTIAAIRPTEEERHSLQRYATRVAQAALPAVRNITTRALQKLKIEVSANLDPRLQVAVVRRSAGLPAAAAASASGNEVPVLAKVSDLAAWEALSEVRIGTAVEAEGEKGVLVTARIPITRIEAVRAQPFVLSLKASQVLHPSLKATVEEMGCQPASYPAGTNPQGGKGVLIGIVDYGCDFKHENFRNADGSSRVEVLWNQNGKKKAGQSVDYGRVYTKKEIDTALLKADPYKALGYIPYEPQPPDEGAHGTHVMDIATGNGRGTGQPGCAPEADIAFVDVAGNDYSETYEDVVKKSFGDSVQLAEAIQFLFDQAGNRPCVVNISLGTNGGPHDGTTLVEQWIDRLVRAKPNRAVVISGSNSYADGIHAAGDVAAKKKAELSWDMKLGQYDREMEIWYPEDGRLAVELISPDGVSQGVVEPGKNLTLGQGNQIAVFVSNRLGEPNNGDNAISIFVAAGVPGGTWTARLHNRANKQTSFHAWLERDDREQNNFQGVTDNTHTIGSVSCGFESIVVGSFDAHKPSLPLSWFSSEGPTRDGRQKPEISAPGHVVVAALSRSGDGVTRKSGTSMAAPAVTGLVALLLAEANRKGVKMTSAEIRHAIISTARRNPPPGTAWDGRYGMGRAHINAIT